MKDISYSSTSRIETPRKTFEIFAPIASNSRQTRGHRSHASDIRTAKSFLTVIGAYFFCWTPFCVKLFLDILKQEKINPKVSLIFLWLGYTNSCLNPLIYTWKYKQFRSALISTMKKFRGRFSVSRSSRQ